MANGKVPLQPVSQCGTGRSGSLWITLLVFIITRRIQETHSLNRKESDCLMVWGFNERLGSTFCDLPENLSGWTSV